MIYEGSLVVEEKRKRFAYAVKDLINANSS